MAETALAQLRVRPAATPSLTPRRGHDVVKPSVPSRWARMSRFGHYARRPLSQAVPVAFGVALTLALVIGWSTREQEYIVPENGLGYWLGIAGGSLMLLLLAYPLRKRMRGLRRFGSVAFWFRLHMVFGLVGPALILFHANFRMGSLNSNVALIAMLIVATSGIVGRYLYGKIHLGLYGRKAEVGEILADAEIMIRTLGAGLPVGDHLLERLNAFAKQVIEISPSFFRACCLLPTLGLRARMLRRRLLRDARRTIAAEAKRNGWSRVEKAQRIDAIAELVTLHLAAVKKAAAFVFYERLFALWHALHLPLFVILIFASGIHVVAAHLY